MPSNNLTSCCASTSASTGNSNFSSCLSAYKSDIEARPACLEMSGFCILPPFISTISRYEERCRAFLFQAASGTNATNLTEAEAAALCQPLFAPGALTLTTPVAARCDSGYYCPTAGSDLYTCQPRLTTGVNCTRESNTESYGIYQQPCSDGAACLEVNGVFQCASLTGPATSDDLKNPGEACVNNSDCSGYVNAPGTKYAICSTNNTLNQSLCGFSPAGQPCPVALGGYGCYTPTHFCSADTEACEARLPPGFACPADIDAQLPCQNGTICRASNSTHGVCGPYISAGGACDEDREGECVPGTFCKELNASYYECTLPIAAGGNCSNAQDCDDGLLCIGNPGQCSALRSAGQTCSDVTHCQLGLYCDINALAFGFFPSNANGPSGAKCTSPQSKTAGMTCTENFECGVGMTCTLPSGVFSGLKVCQNISKPLSCDPRGETCPNYDCSVAQQAALACAVTNGCDSTDKPSDYQTIGADILYAALYSGLNDNYKTVEPFFSGSCWSQNCPAEVSCLLQCLDPQVIYRSCSAGSSLTTCNTNFSWIPVPPATGAATTGSATGVTGTTGSGSTTGSDAASSSSEEFFTTAVIIGFVVGALVLVAIIVIVCACLLCKRGKNSKVEHFQMD